MYTLVANDSSIERLPAFVLQDLRSDHYKCRRLPVLPTAAVRWYRTFLSNGQCIRTIARNLQIESLIFRSQCGTLTSTGYLPFSKLYHFSAATTMLAKTTLLTSYPKPARYTGREASYACTVFTHIRNHMVAAYVWITVTGLKTPTSILRIRQHPLVTV